MIALATPAPKGHWGIPALLWGAPGTGKSTFVEGLKKDGFPVVTMIASLHDPTDFNGLPVLRDGRMHFAPPDWVYEFSEKGGILFLDELTTAPPSVQAALLRLVLERKVGAHPLPERVRIVAAANPPNVAASGWELSAPLANRFVHIEWNLEGEAYANALEMGFESRSMEEWQEDRWQARYPFWKNIVAQLLRRNPALAYTQPAEDEYAFASPRTWDYAIALMTTCDVLGKAPLGERQSGEMSAFVNLVKGAVGSGACTAFLKFIREMRIPDPEEVLRGEAKVDARLRVDELHVLFGTMASLLLNWKGAKKGPDLQTGITHFLHTALMVAKSKKPDSAYTSLRRLVKEG
ncbi:MAG: AAA family ATPase, partial [Fimbriimonadales bacterium]|nr:AAA family ATPase [Fimbriimonadales bacterium]